MPKLLSKVQVLQVYYLISFSYCQCRWLLSFKLPHNGPRIGDSGGLESLNFHFCTKLSNSLLLFSKFMKKGNIKGCCDKKKEKLSISPLNRHFANTMLADGVLFIMFVICFYEFFMIFFRLFQ